jgi:hypothetical protein
VYKADLSGDAPFASGDQAVDRNGDGKMDNEAADSYITRRQVTIARPSAPNVTRAWRSGDVVTVNWEQVDHPSNKVHHWYACNWSIPSSATQSTDRFGPYDYDVTSANVGVSCYFFGYAENLGGEGPNGGPVQPSTGPSAGPGAAP